MKSQVWRCVYAILCCFVMLAVIVALAPIEISLEIAIADTRE